MNLYQDKVQHCTGRITWNDASKRDVRGIDIGSAVLICPATRAGFPGRNEKRTKNRKNNSVHYNNNGYTYIYV